MTRYGPACEIDEDEDTPEMADLRQLVCDFDNLMEYCWDPSLGHDSEKMHTLNKIYEALMHIEESHWIGASDKVFALIQSRTDEAFPMIRFQLGMLSTSLESV